jgi:outer membrane protein X
MRKILFLILMLTIMLGVSAQESKNSLQANILYGSKIETAGVGLTFNLTGKKHEFSPSVNFYFPKNGFKMAEINFDYHRLYGIGDKVKAFPILGLAISNWNGDLVEDKTKFGVNLGVGGRYDINDRFHAGFQFKYSAMSNSGSQSVPMITIGYKL